VITASLWSHARPHRLGQVFTADAGYWLERDPDTVRAPDVAFVSRARFEAVGDTAAFWPGPPDLAVEVLSPEDRPGAVREKVADWLRAGCEMVLVVDPERRSVIVYGPARAPVRLGSAAVIDGEHVVPGWRMPVAAAFETG
jgi:Uma2 family endonuclease